MGIFKKRLFSYSFVLFFLLFVLSIFIFKEKLFKSKQASYEGPQLIIYTYESLAAPGSWGQERVQAFEKKMKEEKTPVQVQLISVGEGAQMVNRLKLEERRKKSPAHLLWGIDLDLFSAIRPEVSPTLLEGQKISLTRDLKGISFPKGFIPFDYGFYALIQDTQLLPLEEAPQDWSDLSLPRYKNQLLFQDPRTSIPGWSWLQTSEVVFLQKKGVTQEAFALFLKQLRENTLTLSPSWTQAYALFLKGQAPLVWSLITSQAYHDEKTPGRYRAVLFQSGTPIQIEGFALLKNAKDFEKMKPWAEKFVEFILSLESQTLLPQKQWMLPVREGISLPPSFQHLPKVSDVIRLDQNLEGGSGMSRNDLLDFWQESLQNKAVQR